MDNSEKVNMEIIIGGQPVKLTIPFNKQDFVRDVEDEIAALYTNWRKLFPRKDDRELLAMIAYQYASYYKELTLKHEEALRMAIDCESKIDSINL